MPLFRKETPIPFDPETQEVAVRKSICTGEMTVGFIDKETGHFHDYMRMHNQKELDEFCRAVGAKDIRVIY